MKLETRVGLFILVAIGAFLYLSINIRAIRFDRDQYNIYRAYFDETNGLAAKASVKIAGVEIGWVEEIKLLSDGKAELMMRIDKRIRLAKNACARIHQDGLIGTKNLEIEPGDPSTGFLSPGSALSMPGRAPASVGELLDQFRDIANTVQDVVAAFKNVFASHRGEENMRNALNSIATASDRIADFSVVLQRTMNHNEENINSLLTDFRYSMLHLRNAVPAIKDDMHAIAKSAGESFEHFGDAAIQGRETLRETGEVVEKINSGKGVIGKLINEDEAYGDLKKTIRGFKDYVGKTTGLLVSVDMHGENLLRHSYTKGYLDLRLRPNSDFFYQVQLVASEQGTFQRTTEYITRKDDKGNVMHAGDLPVPLFKKVELADQIDRTVQKQDAILFGLQFGKRFDRLAFRMGLFENSFGFACDYYVPLPTDKLHWITTIELFDMRGINRLNDTRPHLKWINRAFFMKNLYTAFGVDDICSKNSANPFFGGGIRFNDDDLKYFLSSLSAGAKAGG
ncbi:MAG: MlaD family protein [Candidatus Babeliales bacterium]